MGAPLLCRHLDLSLHVSSAARVKQAHLGTNQCNRHYPKTPDSCFFLWAMEGVKHGSSGLFDVGGGSTARGIQPRLRQVPSALTLNSSSTAEAGCIFLLNRGQFPLLFPSENSPLPLISSTSLARVSLSSLSILDISTFSENQQEGRQDSLLKVEIVRQRLPKVMIKKQKE